MRKLTTAAVAAITLGWAGTASAGAIYDFDLSDKSSIDYGQKLSLSADASSNLSLSGLLGTKSSKLGDWSLFGGTTKTSVLDGLFGKKADKTSLLTGLLDKKTDKVSVVLDKKLALLDYLKKDFDWGKWNTKQPNPNTGNPTQVSEPLGFALIGFLTAGALVFWRRRDRGAAA